METADGSSRDIAHGLFAVSVPLRDGMDAGCCRLLSLTNTLLPCPGGRVFLCLRPGILGSTTEMLSAAACGGHRVSHLNRKGRNTYETREMGVSADDFRNDHQLGVLRGAIGPDHTPTGDLRACGDRAASRGKLSCYCAGLRRIVRSRYLVRSPSTSFLRVHVLSLLNCQIN